MEIRMRNIKNITPYDRNTKNHDKKQINNVAQSIKQYGFVQPIVIDTDGVIVIGHCRYAAAKKLRLKEVPCVCVEDLTPDEVNALRIVDNKTNESEWNTEMLNIELPEIDLSAFDFSLDKPEVKESETETAEIFDDVMQEYEHQENLDDMQYRRENILQLAKGQFYGENKYDIPELSPVYDLPPIEEWIDFDYVLREKEPQNKGVHFFIDDYKFERIWKTPEKYLDKLKQFAVVATPDFSPYGDMPLICQMFNHYRKHWVGVWLQEHGVTVIPTIRCSTDPRSLEWYLDGEPKGGIVIMSAMWSKGQDIAKDEYRLMKETLKPKKIFIYGKGDMGESESDNIEYIPTYTGRRFKANGEV